jgi:hypothetical protein
MKHFCLAVLVVFVAAFTFAQESPVPVGSKIAIAPMGGFDTYLAAAIQKEKVPVVLTLDKENADLALATSEQLSDGWLFGAASQGSASWTANGGSASSTGAAAGKSTRTVEAGIMLVNLKTKQVVWAYEVHKSKYQQAAAESCAKHLKDFIIKGK